MAVKLFELGAKGEDKPKTPGSSVVTGTVLNNCELPVQGKVLVRIPSLDQEVWARLTALGAGASRGFLFVPQIDDEVLIALNQNDPTDAFILGGLWNTQDPTPVSDPTAITKRVIKTGLKAGIGHEMEFDDLQQTITITSTTQQKITISPTKIELTNLAGSVKITLDNKTQSISIQALNSIDLSAQGQINLKAGNININGKLATTITGKPVAIN